MLLMVFLLVPLNIKILWRNKNPHLFYLLAAYLASMVAFTNGTEEFAIMFGITYALFIFEIGKNQYIITETMDDPAASCRVIHCT